MKITNRTDGIHIINHGVLSISELAAGVERLNPMDLGDALAKVNRYAGNTTVPWNDAEHSMLVAGLIDDIQKLVDVEELFLSRPTVVDTVRLWRFLMKPGRRGIIMRMAETWGLLHDVVEVVVGDMPNPAKKFDEQEARRSGETAENLIVEQLKLQTFAPLAWRLATEFVGTSTWSTAQVSKMILELLQDFVKPADKLALLVEMKYLHEPEVLDYVYRMWGVNPATVDYVNRSVWMRLQSHALHEHINWRESARRWTRALELRTKALNDACRLHQLA